MNKIATLIGLILFVFFSGCKSPQQLYVHGESSILSHDWKSKIKVGETTEQDILSLLGYPSGVFHKTPNSNELYLFYSAIATVWNKTHYVLFDPGSKMDTYESREWFLISNGKLIKHVSATTRDGDPDLNGFMASSSLEYPYCERVKSQ